MTASERTDTGASRRWHAARFLFGSLGIMFAVFALRGTWREVRSDIAWSPAAIAAGTILVIVTTMTAARLWAALNPEMKRGRSLSVYYAAIVGKYIPGGVFQFIGQVGYAAREGAAVGLAAGRFVLSMVTIVSAGLIVAGLAAFESGFPTWVRIVAGLGTIIGVALTRRSILQTVLDFGVRLTRRAGTSALPSQASLNEAVAWGAAGLLVLGASFSIVASQITDGAVRFVPVAGFLVAWLIGFLAVPFPAGIGVREAVLVWLLSPALPTAAVVAASLAHRLITIAGEIILYASSRIGSKLHD